MKTTILLFATMIFAGMIFASGEKNNAQTEGQSTVYELNTELAVTDGDRKGNGIASIPDLITNYPDPFINMTQIEYQVPRSSWVTLVVYNKKEFFQMRLVSEFQHEGVYRVDFNASELPPGEYIAELRIGWFVFTEEMTKIKKEGIGRIRKDIK